MTRNRHSRPSGKLIITLLAWAVGIALLGWWGYSALSKGDTETETETVASATPVDTVMAPAGSWRHKQAKKQQRQQGQQLLDMRLAKGMREVMLDDEAFRIYYNNDLRIPNAVVYELTRKEASSHSAKRRDEFTEDPNVANSASPTDYLGSGYDRGHMAPAGDMKWSQHAMNRTFMMSNICPQRHDLNAGAWNDLEIRVRQWAKRDSALIVITGPIIGENPKRIGRGRNIAVPKAFFKVIYAPFANPRRAIAFIMPNADDVASQLDRYAVSIDEVERATGYDFLYVLPDNLEDVVEAQCNFSQWNKRH